MKRTKRKVSVQKIFSFISFIFILTCCLWYGGRFIYFHEESKKTVANETDSAAKALINANHEKKTFKKSGDKYYFYHDADSNYVIYSNILWRIVKINEDDSIMIVTDDAITNLAYGTDSNYDKSMILKWLNIDKDLEYSGVLENKLNSVSSYLVKESVCIDSIDDVKNLTCEKENKDYYLSSSISPLEI